MITFDREDFDILEEYQETEKLIYLLTNQVAEQTTMVGKMEHYLSRDRYHKVQKDILATKLMIGLLGEHKALLEACLNNGVLPDVELSSVIM